MFIKRRKNGAVHFVAGLSNEGAITKLVPTLGEAVSFSTKEALACELFYKGKAEAGTFEAIPDKGDAKLSPAERAEQELASSVTRLSTENTMLKVENAKLKAELKDAKEELELFEDDIKAKAIAAKLVEAQAAENKAKAAIAPPSKP